MFALGSGSVDAHLQGLVTAFTEICKTAGVGEVLPVVVDLDFSFPPKLIPRISPREAFAADKTM